MDDIKTRRTFPFDIRDAALVSMGIMLIWCLSQIAVPGRVDLLAMAVGLVIILLPHIFYPLTVWGYYQKNKSAPKMTGIVILVLFWMIFIPYMIMAPREAGGDAQGGLVYFFGPLCANALLTVLLGIYWLVRFCIRAYRNWGDPGE